MNNKLYKQLIYLTLAIASLRAGYLAAEHNRIYDRYDESLTALGDLDGDGVSDYALANPGYHWEQEPPLTGRVDVFSGRTESLLYRLQGTENEQHLGVYVVAGGDINNDGTPDFLVRDNRRTAEGEEAGSLHAISGIDGRRIFRVTGGVKGNLFPVAAAIVGDINGDGHRDVVAATSWPNKHSGITAISGKDGSRLYKALAFEQEENEGYLSMVALSDLDGDKIRDFAIGDPFYRDEQRGDYGRVSFYSSRTGNEISTILGDSSDHFFGFTLKLTDDLHGDGQKDLIIGAPHKYTSDRTVTSVGKLEAYNLKTNQRIQSYRDITPAKPLGRYVTMVDDIDEDGAPDVLTALSSTTILPMQGHERFFYRDFETRLVYFSGRTGRFLHSRLVGNIDLRRSIAGHDVHSPFVIGTEKDQKVLINLYKTPESEEIQSLSQPVFQVSRSYITHKQYLTFTTPVIQQKCEITLEASTDKDDFSDAITIKKFLLAHHSYPLEMPRRRIRNNRARTLWLRFRGEKCGSHGTITSRPLMYQFRRARKEGKNRSKAGAIRLLQRLTKIRTGAL